MARKYGSTSAGVLFDDVTIQAVWNKGKIIPGRNPSQYRMDTCNALIERNKYGVTTPQGTGWEIDHIRPISKGGADGLFNLQPLQWENNRGKSDNWPNWSCSVSFKAA